MGLRRGWGISWVEEEVDRDLWHPADSFRDDKSKGDGKGDGKDAAVAEMLFG
jgi:hypothetical protein